MILDEIVANKKEELEAVKREASLRDLENCILAAGPRRNFKEALKKNGVSLIAEVKKASPSAGVICRDFDPVRIAASYEQNGAAAISVLTESRYFQGELRFLRQIREKVTLPLLRKDFIFDEYQVYESKAKGADAILLIASLLSLNEIRQLIGLAEELGLDAMVEVHNEEEIDRVLRTEAEIIGINNRDLKTFAVDLTTTTKLAQIMKDRGIAGKIIVSESGIRTFEDVKLVADAGVDAVLIGEALMRGDTTGKKIKQLLRF